MSKSSATARPKSGKLEDEDEPPSNERSKIAIDADDDSDGGDDGDDGDDGDFNSANQRAKHADEHEYEEDEDKDTAKKTTVEDEGFEEDQQEEKKGSDEEDGEDEEYAEGGEIEIDGVDEEGEATKRKNANEVEKSFEKEMSMAEEALESKIAAVLARDPWIIDYEFDSHEYLSCRLTLSVGNWCRCLIRVSS